MREAVTYTQAARARTYRVKEVEQAPARPRPWLQDFWLWILLVGPLVAPLFMAMGWGVLRPFADGIYLLGDTVCPKVDVHFMFVGYPMAVCTSCWAAVFGLWTIRLLYGRAGEGFGPFQSPGLRRFWARWERTDSSAKLSVLLLMFVPWALDVMLWDLGIWQSGEALMMLFGYLGGLGAGALLLPAASAMRERLASASRRGKQESQVGVPYFGSGS